MADTPLEPREFRRGPGGRPTRAEAERRHRALLATAFRLFLDKGWDGVSMDEISRASGVAKGFIYARYVDKGMLLTEAIERLMADVMGTLRLAGPLPDDVEEGLLGLGRRLLEVALTAEALAFYRQFVAEAPRLRDLARRFVDRSNPLQALIAEVLVAYSGRGAIAVDDPGLAAEQFATLVIGVPRARALCVGRDPPAEEERRLRAAVRLFLSGCGRN